MTKYLVIAGLILLIAALVGFNLWPSYRGLPEHRNNQATENEVSNQKVQKLVSSEELLLKLTPRLRGLSTSVMNLQLPDASANQLFAKEVDVSGAWAATGDSPTPNGQSNTHGWHVEDLATVVARESLDFWPALFEVTD